jgi:hypothetical protein
MIELHNGSADAVNRQKTREFGLLVTTQVSDCVYEWMIYLLY